MLWFFQSQKSSADILPTAGMKIARKNPQISQNLHKISFFFFSKCTRNNGFSSLRLTMKTSTESSRDFCDSWIFSWTLIGTQIFLIQKSYTAHTEMLNMNAKKKEKRDSKELYAHCLKRIQNKKKKD